MIATRRRRDKGTPAARGDAEARLPAPVADVVARDGYLRSAHGFLVDRADGGEVGVVDEIEVDPETGRVARVHVCGGWFGRRRSVVAADEVVAVYPSLRRLVVTSDAGGERPS